VVLNVTIDTGALLCSWLTIW